MIIILNIVNIVIRPINLTIPMEEEAEVEEDTEGDMEEEPEAGKFIRDSEEELEEEELSLINMLKI